MSNLTGEHWYTTIFSDAPQQENKSQTITLVIILILMMVMILLKVIKRIQRVRKSEFISPEMLDEGCQFLMSFMREIVNQRYDINLDATTEQPMTHRETLG